MTPAGGYNPFGHAGWDVRVFGVNDSGYFDDLFAGSNYALRPVINIRSDVTITGSGTMTDPYVVAQDGRFKKIVKSFKIN